MKSYALDTNIVSYALKGQKKIQEKKCVKLGTRVWRWSSRQ
jgi:predicted nucleic acid-binding protein